MPLMIFATSPPKARPMPRRSAHPQQRFTPWLNAALLHFRPMPPGWRYFESGELP